MIADTEDELHAFAQSIGIKRQWYQNNHYDVSLHHRKIAVEKGAIEVTMRDLVKILRRNRLQIQ